MTAAPLPPPPAAQGASIADDLELMAAHVHAESPATKAAKLQRLAERVRALEAERQLLTHKVITCGVAASHSDAGLSRRGAYAAEWNSQQAEQVRALRDKAEAAEAALAEARELIASIDHFIPGSVLGDELCARLDTFLKHKTDPRRAATMKEAGVKENPHA